VFPVSRKRSIQPSERLVSFDSSLQRESELDDGNCRSDREDKERARAKVIQNYLCVSAPFGRWLNGLIRLDLTGVASLQRRRAVDLHAESKAAARLSLSVGVLRSR
jgi:hypothetical protein